MRQVRAISSTWTDLEDLSPQSCGRGVGGRACDALAGDRSLFSSALCVLQHPRYGRGRRIHVNVTRSPTDPWVARTATGGNSVWTHTNPSDSGERPEIRAEFCTSGGIKWHQCPSNAVPNSRRANAICERFLGSVRRACLDHFLIWHEKQLHRLLKGYVLYFNQTRPHQGLGQRIPDPPMLAASPPNQPHQVIAFPVLGGLHHDYQRAA